MTPHLPAGNHPSREAAHSAESLPMKETSSSKTRKNQSKRTSSTSIRPAKISDKNPASKHTRSSPRHSAAEAESRASHRRVHKTKAEVEPIRGEGARKRSPRRKSSAVGLENWMPQHPVHVGGVMKRGPQQSDHFAGVENRSYAAHLDGVATEPHPKAALNPMHGPFPARLKQP